MASYRGDPLAEAVVEDVVHALELGVRHRQPLGHAGAGRSTRRPGGKEEMDVSFSMTNSHSFCASGQGVSQTRTRRDKRMPEQQVLYRDSALHPL
jgi:hypothetical protein